MRATVPGASSVPRERRVEIVRLRLRKQPSYYRPLADLERAVVAAGFRPILVEAPPNREETWIVAERG